MTIGNDHKVVTNSTKNYDVTCGKIMTHFKVVTSMLSLGSCWNEAQNINCRIHRRNTSFLVEITFVSLA